MSSWRHHQEHRHSGTGVGLLVPMTRIFRQLEKTFKATTWEMPIYVSVMLRRLHTFGHFCFLNRFLNVCHTEMSHTCSCSCSCSGNPRPLEDFCHQEEILLSAIISKINVGMWWFSVGFALTDPYYWQLNRLHFGIDPNMSKYILRVFLAYRLAIRMIDLLAPEASPLMLLASRSTLFDARYDSRLTEIFPVHVQHIM